ncbi:uncharacterized protein LOC134750086 [Cydia strobilella]|uniref:uncharacterized protein LOC134750086 n=1 Tax=Cydia strobilella TaxID=1100964 RepID=UPI0030043421
MFYFLTSIIISCSFLFLDAAGQIMLGPGMFSVISTQPCENDADMPWRMRLHKHKLNRTHDAFDGEVSLLAELDDSYGARIDVCKMGDGGCKPFIRESRECIPCLARAHASENVRAVLVALGINPPDFPVPKGEYRLDNYLVNAEDLDKISVYGEYHGTGYVVKDGQDVACYRMLIKFEPIDNFGSFPALYG